MKVIRYKPQPPKVPAPDKELKEILEPKVIESVAPHKEEKVGKEEKQTKEKKGLFKRP
jgi:hypothetical protein